MRSLGTRTCTNILLIILIAILAGSYAYASYTRSSCVKISVPPESRENIANEFQLGIIEYAYDFCVSSYGVSR